MREWEHRATSTGMVTGPIHAPLLDPTGSADPLIILEVAAFIANGRVVLNFAPIQDLIRCLGAQAPVPEILDLITRLTTNNNFFSAADVSKAFDSCRIDCDGFEIHVLCENRRYRLNTLGQGLRDAPGIWGSSTAAAPAPRR